MNTFDIDGVIYMGPGRTGVFPGPDDVIITGRSGIDEKQETIAMLEDRGITNKVFMNPVRFDEKTRKSSGEHKARVIRGLISDGFDIKIHFEDDEVQADIIRRAVPEIEVVVLQHNLTEKENVRNTEWK